MVEHTIRTFPSLGAMIDYVSGPCDVPAWDRKSHTVSPERTQFTGTKSWDEAMSITHRWDEGIARIDAMRVAISDADRAPRTTLRKSVAPPGRIDIGGIAAGDPAAGYLRRRQVMTVKRQQGKVIRVLVNTGCSAGVTTDTIMRRGAAILALVDMLEARGFRADIMGCAPITAPRARASRIMEHRWIVKRPEERVSLAALAFGLAHPSMHRRVVFAARECESAADRTYFDIVRTMGSSATSLMADEVIASGGIYLDRIPTDSPFEDDDSARAWVKGEVERIMSGR